jgi:hypothetical protein
MTTAADIIKSALRKINSYQSGEPLSNVDAQDCLECLNDLLDSWSTDDLLVFGVEEWALSWTAGKNAYSIGNPTNEQLSGANSTGDTFPRTWPNITGTLTSGSPTITSVTNMPSNLVAGSQPPFTVGCGSTLSDVQNLIPAGTTVFAFDAGAQTITMSANATGNSVGSDSIAYTVPGDFPIPRLLRLTGGYTRFNQLDFTLDIAETQAKYNAILYKAQPGPWPTVGWYNAGYPYGELKVAMTPGNNSPVYLFADTILSNLTLNQPFMVPQGYSRAIKWSLAKELCAEYGFPVSEAIKTNAQQSVDFIKALNATPARVSFYDRALIRGNRGDGGWILSGGYG